MVLREDTEEAARRGSAGARRQGRHGRPKPFGGRLRLPTLRVSGAAMAMSTVVGISIATTCLLNEQQGVGRRAGMARVGSSAPPPGADRPEAGATTSAGPGTTGPSASVSASTSPSASVSAAASPSRPPTTAPAAPGGQGDPNASTAPAPATATGAPSPGPATPGAADPVAPAATPEPAPSSAGTAVALGQSPAPADAGPAPTDPAPRPLIELPGVSTGPGSQDETFDDGFRGEDPQDATEDPALTGTALVQSVGRDGTRHRLGLTVTEPLTALQAEFRLAPGGFAPGTGTVWTDLPGVVVTTQHEHGTLVYRFTVLPGTDVRPGHYTFGVRGLRPAGHRAAGPAPAESWTAAAFGIDRPRAVAALGTFTRA